MKQKTNNLTDLQFYTHEWETFFYFSILVSKDKYQKSFSYGRGKTSPNDMQIKEKVAKASIITILSVSVCIHRFYREYST